MKLLFLSPPCRKTSRLVLLSLITLGLVFSSCYHRFYKTNSSNKVDAVQAEQLVSADKCFILHSNHLQVALLNVKVNNGSFEGDTDSLPPEHSKYLAPKSPDGNRYKAADQEAVLYEVHLYTEIQVAMKSHVIIPFGNVKMIDVYSKDKTATTRSTIGSTVVVTLVTAAAVGVIIVATTPAPAPTTTTTNVSCSPQVYAGVEKNKELNGTLFSGAIYASLERRDFLPVQASVVPGDILNIQIKGEKKEELFFNEISLLEFTHAAGTRVLLDRHGKPFVFGQLNAPIRASAGEKAHALEDVLKRDGKYYSFTNHSSDGNTSDIMLTFRKPRGVTSGRLVLRAKNSAWSYYLFKQFKSLYGDSYNALLQKKDKANPDQVLKCELDQSLPLLVSIKEDNQWKPVDYFLTPGNALPRDMIMDIDLAALQHESRVEIRLQTTFMFWDLDFAGMDFSENNCYTARRINPDEAAMSNGSSHLREISHQDSSYARITESEPLNLKFNTSGAAAPGWQHSYFLEGCGYYHDITQYPGKANLIALSAFSGQGAFDRFSRERFKEILRMGQITYPKNPASSQ